MSVSVEPVDPRVDKPETLRLTAARAGNSYVVVKLAKGLQCSGRLRELCIFEGESVKLKRRSDPLLVEVRGGLIAIDLETAAGIEVQDAGCL